MGFLPARHEVDDELRPAKTTDWPELNPARVNMPNINPTLAFSIPGLASALDLGDDDRDFLPTAPAGGAPVFGDEERGAIERP